MIKNKICTNKLSINCKAVAENYRILEKFIGNKVACAANIKFNAYGLGLMPIMRTLSKAGCHKFFVSSLDEAIELRNSSLTDEIYVLDGICSNEAEEFAHQNITPIINTPEQFDLFNNYCRRKNKSFTAALNIDTGSNMIGFPAEEALQLAEKTYFQQKAKITFIMSYFFPNPTLYNPNTPSQTEIIKKIKKAFSLPISLADSSAITLGKDYHFDMVRAGLLLYGACNTEELGLNNAISLTSRIVQVSKVKEGYITNGNNPNSKNPTTIATISIGYGDGISPALSNRAIFYIHGHPAPVIGRVTMNFIMLDVSNVPQYHLYPGSEVELLGDNYTIDKMANDAETSSSYIITSLNSKIQRIYNQ